MSENDKDLSLDGQETTEEATAETPSEEPTGANVARAKREYNRSKRILEEAGELKAPEESKKEEPKVENQNGYDNRLVSLSYLNSVDVKNESDQEWALEQAEETGKSLDYLVKAKWFNEELSTRKQSRANKDAAPSGTKRSGPATRTNADHWFAKIERGESTMADVPKDIMLEVHKLRNEKHGGGNQIVPGLGPRR